MAPRFPTLMAGCWLGFAAGAFGEPAPVNESLRNELLAMREADQGVRETRIATVRMREVDLKNEARMKAIVAEVGWPGKSLVGKDGASAAWLIVQHCGRELQEHCLPLLKAASESGEAMPKHYAHLLDRVLVHRGEPQIYGTQFRGQGSTFGPYPIADREHLDERRRQVGLEPFADYERRISEPHRSAESSK